MTCKTKVTLSDLEINYDKIPALKDLNAVFEGKTIGVIGHNGAGKSTLIKTILGLLKPKNGSFEVKFEHKGESSFSLIPERDMAFCPETGSVFSDISVETYIRLWCRIKHNDAKYYKKNGSEIIEELAIPQLLNKLGKHLSKGQRRRVQTAIGFLCNPKLFLFDEPFDGLDIKRSHELTNLIIEKSSKMNFIISSHRMDVMERTADFLVVLEEGKILSFGETEKVCKELCGGSFLVTVNPKKLNNLEELSRKFFKKALVYSIGHQVMITQKGLNKDQILKVFKDNGLNEGQDIDLDCEEIHPSLVDAMNYHMFER